MIFDATQSEVFVFTFKDGVLSPMAHDLKLRVTRFRIAVGDGGRVDATFDAASVRVVCARKDGEDAPRALPSLLFSEVERNIDRDVLKPRRFPEITFVAESSGAQSIAGTLTLCGVTRPVSVALTHEKDAGGRDVTVGRARIDQREFGITPFSAALGTLKVKPQVDIEVRVPSPPAVTLAST